VSSTLSYFLVVRVLLLPIVCHCVSQSLLLRNTHLSSLSQLTIISKLSPHHPVPWSLYPPINRHCTTHRIADPQTNIHAYSTTKKTIHHQHHHYHNIPVLQVTVTSYKPLPLHNVYRETYIISYIQYISCTNIN